MLTKDQLELRRLEGEVERLGNFGYVGTAGSAWLDSLDVLLPPETITTTEAAKKRWLPPSQEGAAALWTPEKAPYSVGIQDACDEPGVEVIAAQGPSRSLKTTSFENHLFKRLKYGPHGNVIYYMQSDGDLDDYIDERGEFLLTSDPDINGKIDAKDRRNGRKRKKVGDDLILYKPATNRTTIGKAAPLIIADEIDAYEKKLRKALLNRLRGRQREFGAAAKLCLASHADAGSEGIAGIIAQGIRHLWWWQCPHCAKPSSPAAEAKVRMDWNVSTLLERLGDMPREQILEVVEHEAALVCPHCQKLIAADQRLTMSNAGKWLQPQQEMMDDGEIAGERRTGAIMGFVIHAFMSPFVNIGKLAKEYVQAKWTFDDTQDDTVLREVTVKSIGEVYEGGKAEERVEDWKVVKARLSAPYPLKRIPRGVDFLTAFVDVQGDRFEVVVIGWSRWGESWLIDRFPIKQWPGFDTIDPANRLKDWETIEHAVLDQLYEFVERPGWYLPIARVVIDNNGVAGVINNERVWLSNLTYRGVTAGGRPFESYRVMLVRGGSSKTQEEVYGTPRPVMKDDAGRPLLVQIYERAANVYRIKKMIVRRMKIEMPGEPGRMNLPSNLSDRYWRELTSERLINDDWIASGRNETFDGYVGCETARFTLRSDLVVAWGDDPDAPDWVAPVRRDWGRAEDVAEVVETPISPWERVARMNAGEADYATVVR